MRRVFTIPVSTTTGIIQIFKLAVLSRKVKTQKKGREKSHQRGSAVGQEDERKRTIKSGAENLRTTPEPVALPALFVGTQRGAPWATGHANSQ